MSLKPCWEKVLVPYNTVNLSFLLNLKRPTFPIRNLDIFVRLFVIRKPHICAVPIELLAPPYRNAAQKYQFGQVAANLKIGTSLLAALTGVEPITMMPFRPRQNFRRPLMAAYKPSSSPQE